MFLRRRIRCELIIIDKAVVYIPSSDSEGCISCGNSSADIFSVIAEETPGIGSDALSVYFSDIESWSESCSVFCRSSIFRPVFFAICGYYCDFRGIRDFPSG
jgi:hypothetical protein